MLNWNQVLAQQEHYQDMLREAEKTRLVRLARAEQPAGPGLAPRGLAWLGRRLVQWGQNLEERYGVDPDTASVAMADCW